MKGDSMVNKVFLYLGHPGIHFKQPDNAVANDAKKPEMNVYGFEKGSLP